MAKKLAGRASVYTIDGTLAFTGTAVLLATENEVQTATSTDEFDTNDLLDRHGEVIGTGARNRRQTISVEIAVTDASGDSPQAEAGAKSAMKYPDKLGIVTLASFGVADIDGTYNYMGGGSIALTNEGYARVTLPIRRVGDTPAALALVP